MFVKQTAIIFIAEVLWPSVSMKESCRLWHKSPSELSLEISPSQAAQKSARLVQISAEIITIISTSNHFGIVWY